MFKLVNVENGCEGSYLVDGVGTVLAVVSDKHEGEYLADHLNNPQGNYTVVDISDGDVEDPLFSIQRDGEETVFIHENESTLLRLVPLLNRKG